MTARNEVQQRPNHASWFEDGQAEAVRDLWSVCRMHLDRIEPSTLDESRTTLLLALDGDWAAYHARLERRAVERVDAGVNLSVSCDEVHALARGLLPHLVAAYAEEPTRLTAAIQAMNDFTSGSAAVITRTYFERNDAEARAREQDLATTLHSIGDAVVVTDANGCVTRMNAVAERLTGFALSDCENQPLDRIFRIENETSGAPVESPVPRVLREGVVVGLANHTVLVARDGSRRPIADSGAPIRRENGEVGGVVLVFRDVTEDRRAEESLRHWERIFQHATWGVAVASARDVRFQAVNPMYAEMHGYTVEELLGAPVSTLWAPETRADMERHAHETHGHGRLVVETTHVCKDGTLLPVEVVATTIKDADGKVVSFIAYVQDITERKRLQQSQIRAVELEAENRRIEEANRLKSEFLANMSHELRTPLNSIVGFTELLHDGQVGPISVKQKEFLGEILAGSVHLLRLINDVLDLAKVEAGKMDFRSEPVDLRVLVNTVVQNLRTTAMSKRLNVDVSVDPSLVDIVLDPGRFKQLLYNYVSNALKFTPDGGRVTVRASPEPGDRFRVEVEDTGPGLSPEDAAHLFLPFRQLDAGAAKRHGGTGLGLALTKRLAEAQGGTVGMRAATSGGSIFSATLPRRAPDSAGQPETHADVSPSPTVLVVESDPGDRAVLVRILKDAGYDVEAVSTGAEAIAAWDNDEYDAIALSLVLPGDEVHALLDRVHADASRPNVPVIALTVVSRGRTAAGFAVTDLLTKPVDAAALLGALERSGVPASRGSPVLVVDDDPGSLKLMEALLSKLGYDSLCFASAAEALLALERTRPVAIVLDLLMPNMDGFMFLERLRDSPANRRIPVMIWTVKDLSTDERRHLLAAAQTVVQKGGGDESPLSAALRTFLPAQVQSRGGDG